MELITSKGNSNVLASGPIIRVLTVLFFVPRQCSQPSGGPAGGTVKSPGRDGTVICLE